jgi:rhamnulokinase
MRAARRFLAIDLGASSGRIFAASWNGQQLQLSELHRFLNSSVRVFGHIHWDVLRLWSEINNGLQCYSRSYGRELTSLAVDAWGVDFALLDSEGRLVGNPQTYRDKRTNGIVNAVFAQIREEELFSETGNQSWQINTLFQLFSMVMAKDPQLESAATLLMIPDLFTYWLCGEKTVEYTAGSTSQMMCVGKPQWADKLLSKLQIPSRILPPISMPGTILATLQRQITNDSELELNIPVVAVASHDTTSALAAIPDMTPDSVFIICGTWSLVGVETNAAITSEQALRLGFSNEVGAAGSVLTLCDVTGLWLIQECKRRWEIHGVSYSWEQLERIAEAARPFRSLIISDATDFAAPVDMPSAIREFCIRTDQPPPDEAAEFIRCCVESLSLRFREVVDGLEQLTQRRLTTLRMVGGGSQNAFLCQSCADATQRTVIAGPVEASAMGNALTQAIAMGHIGTISEGREAISASVQRSRFEPRPVDGWNDAYERFRALKNGPDNISR